MTGLRASSAGVLLLFGLMACGGGGGGGDPAPEPSASPTPPPSGAPAPAIVRGEVTLPSTHRIDADTNDADSVGISNNSCETAQLLPSSVALNGFVGQGAEGGRFDTTADSADYFRTTALAGDVFSITAIDSGGAVAIDIYEGAAASDCSVVTDQTLLDAESIVEYEVQTGGAVTVVLRAVDNAAATYQIRRLPALVSKVASKRPYVPNEAIVRLDRPFTDVAGTLQMADKVMQSLRLASVKHLVGNTVLLRWDNAEGRDTTAAMLKELEALPQVLSADYNSKRLPRSTPNDPRWSSQWDMTNIGVSEAWDRIVASGITPTEVRVAVIDDGMLYDHPDLRDAYLRDANGDIVGCDLVEADFSEDGDGIDGSADDPGTTDFGADGTYHGTHVGGTIAATSNNGIGISGVSGEFPIKIIPVRILPGTVAAELQGVAWASGQNEALSAEVRQACGTLDATTRAQIFNMSYGGPGSDPTADALYAQAANAGIILVAASGNDGSDDPDALGFPASYPKMIVVGASTIDNGIAPYSNFGDILDIAGPGGSTETDLDGNGLDDSVISTVGTGLATQGTRVTDGYKGYEGTSMATPHVAGVLALMKSVYPELTHDQAESLIAQGRMTDDAGTPGKDVFFGYGIVNAIKAVDTAISLAAVTPPPAPTAQLALAPARLNLGSAGSSQGFSVRNTTGGTINGVLSFATPAEPWLSVSASEVDGNGLGSYIATVNRSGLEPGVYKQSVSASVDSLSVSLQVEMEVLAQAAASEPDAGRQYVLLIDAQTDEVVDEIATTVTGGVYSFEFTNVVPGNYLLISSTDLDGDEDVCEDHDACGGSPTLNELAPFVVPAGAEVFRRFTTSYELFEAE